MLIQMDFTIRAKAEGAAVLVKTVAVFLFIRQDLGLFAYALGQLLYSVTLFCLYRALVDNGILKYFTLEPIPHQLTASDSKERHWLSGYVLSEHWTDLVEFSKVCLIKFVLTEGEKLAIFYMTSASSNK